MNRYPVPSRLSVVLAGIVAATNSPHLMAQGASGASALEEVIVTARKRDETLMDVPVAVSAVSARDLRRYAATDLGKIGQMVPQVIIAKTGGGGAGASFTIRGLGSSALDAGIDQTVALNIDGLQVSRGRLVTQSFFDVRQVEVLKGPQALFFGKNSPGGVVSLTTEGPTEELSGYVQLGYEFEADEKIFEGAIAGPLSDTFGYRLALRTSEMEGYIDNNAGPITQPSDPDFPHPGAAYSRDTGTEETLGRLTLEWTPSDTFSARFKLFAAELEDHGETSGTELICDGASRTLDLLAGVFVTDPYSDCKLDGNRTLGALNAERAALYPGAKNGEPYTDYESMLTSLTLNWQVGQIDITSVSGYWSYENTSFDNFGFDSTVAVLGANTDDSDSLTQEFRASSNFDGPLNFTAGVYYEDGSRDTKGNGFIAPVGTDPRTGDYHNWTLVSDNSTESYSVFLQVMYDLTDTLELSVGARYTEEEKTITVGNAYVNQTFALFGITADEGAFTSDTYKDDDLSPEVTLSWRPSSDATFYVAYKTGYKSGGFSNPSILSAGQTVDVLGFDSENAEGAEIGAKGQFLDGRLILTSALYRYKFEGLQLTSFNPSPPSFTIRNAASARTTGVEVEASYLVTDQLRLRLAGGYNRGKYTSFPAAPCFPGQVADTGCSADGTQDLSGTPLVRAPKWNFNAGLSYDHELSDQWWLGMSLDANYTSGYWLQENQNPVSWQKGFTRVNASLRVYTPDDRWELALIGRNLTDKYYGIASADKPFGTPDAIWANIGRPREILLQGLYRF